MLLYFTTLPNYCFCTTSWWNGKPVNCIISLNHCRMFKARDTQN